LSRKMDLSFLMFTWIDIDPWASPGKIVSLFKDGSMIAKPSIIRQVVKFLFTPLLHGFKSVGVQESQDFKWIKAFALTLSDWEGSWLCSAW
jgi:hypothetical protein